MGKGNGEMGWQKVIGTANHYCFMERYSIYIGTASTVRYIVGGQTR